MAFRLFGKKKLPAAQTTSRLTSLPQTIAQEDPIQSKEKIISGRRFLSNEDYVFPKDFPESERLNFQHFFLRSLLKGNYAAPFSVSARAILDVGCGTGIWVRELAQEFPNAHVTGVDLEVSTISASSLLNCHYVSANVVQGLPFPDQQFDFVHQRLLVAALPAKDWPRAVSELVRVTKKGGWVELVDAADAFVKTGPLTEKMMGWWRLAGAKTGFDASQLTRLDLFLLNAGLQSVKQEVVPVPLSWGGHVGDLMGKDMLAIFGNLRALVCTRLQLVSQKEFDQTLDALPTEWAAYQTQFHFFVAYGQKV
ncbi:class I SAM-dependent methyltransferase [Tengunoibacter tsumagoiensis]|uniref:Methyltransferase domain-containing protein n=1 Tax=Tengunoibacter tsumagoiensis TaxID=2014871 RepID=A0A402A9Q3_9CHLR|nr:class I SAM-dependent methyltransferase [Tengunoibacter tsumagoiensis]GCE15859.1 hypothetical protein KTT_57180 [Tengunoibacter tsumagoiensis]